MIFHVNPLPSRNMKHQVLFSLKNNEKICMNVVCCSRNWRFKGSSCFSLLTWQENINVLDWHTGKTPRRIELVQIEVYSKLNKHQFKLIKYLRF